MSRVVLSLGSNLDQPLDQLRTALRELDAAGVRVQRVSTVHRTDPVGYADQPDFCNVTVLAHTDLEPAQVLATGHAIEDAHQRRRTIVNGPRTLDIDVISVDDLQQPDAALPPVLPHPRAHERGFVLVPWLQVEPDALLPGHGRVCDLVAGLDLSGVHPTTEEVW